MVRQPSAIDSDGRAGPGARVGRTRGPKAALALLACLAAGPGLAQDIEPAAIDALRAMGRHLAMLQRFEVTADTAMEVVLDSDQKLLIGGTVFYQVRRPDGLRIDLATDVVHRELYYDGKTAAYVSPDEGYYALIEDPPPTIADLLAQAAGRHGLSFPAADLFAWGGPDEPVDQIHEAFLVGPAMIGDVPVNHWAFRGPDQDWELWIRRDDPPLPLRASLVDRDELARPRFTTSFAWKEQAEIPDAVFSFAPAEGAKQIMLGSVPVEGTTQQGDKP